MIGRCIALALAIAALPAGVRAEQPSPEIRETAIRDIDFVPRGWKLFDKVQGDLNGDGVLDSVLVIQGTDPALQMDNPDGFGVEYHDANPRILLIALSDDDAGFRLAGRDDRIIPDYDSPTIDDPLDWIEVSDGKLTLFVRFWASAGTWTMFTKRFHFRWDGKRMDLIGYDYTNVHRASGELKEVSINYLTGRRKDGSGNIADEGIKETWSRIDPSKRPQLGSIGNAFEFEP